MLTADNKTRQPEDAMKENQFKTKKPKSPEQPAKKDAKGKMGLLGVWWEVFRGIR